MLTVDSVKSVDSVEAVNSVYCVDHFNSACSAKEDLLNKGEEKEEDNECPIELASC